MRRARVGIRGVGRRWQRSRAGRHIQVNVHSKISVVRRRWERQSRLVCGRFTERNSVQVLLVLHSDTLTGTVLGRNGEQLPE